MVAYPHHLDYSKSELRRIGSTLQVLGEVCK
jgi:hypothetical protein